ncbi:MAG: HAD-IIIC family phosphatase [Candidatus Omnitrophica bacterium]|nr:HAD-IIIC family phosphatase [Candidatus Omnitrophota bacterium]
MPPDLQGLLVSDFTADPLAAFLNLPEWPSCRMQTLRFGEPCVHETPVDFSVIWTQAAGTMPAFGRVLRFENVTEEELLADCDVFIDTVRKNFSSSRFVFVMSWTLPYFLRGYGPLDLRQAGGWRRALMTVNRHVIDALSKMPNTYVLDTERWLQAIGEKSCDPRLWYLGKIPFDQAVFKLAAGDIKAALGACLGKSRKIIVLDLDDTLWGGIVGECGWENLRIGGHDAQGEAYTDFQRALKALQCRGVVLAIVSKNDEAVALEAMERHPEMVLKRGDFVAWRINWKDKAANIQELLAQLNLTHEAAVFIDDNPLERARIKEALPGVLVPEWPQNSLLYTKALWSLSCFDTVVVSADDRRRTDMYVQERIRQDLRGQAQGLDQWLASLGTVVNIEPLSPANLPRATQLLNKTNQMNLSTRRLTEDEFKIWSEDPKHQVWAFRVCDRLGDSGLVGLASLQLHEERGRVVDFILSCRVFGRKIEQVMMGMLVTWSRKQGVDRLTAEYRPTQKNKPCLEFLCSHPGFLRREYVFEWDFSHDYSMPAGITVQDAESAQLMEM